MKLTVKDIVICGVYLAIFLIMGLVPNIGTISIGNFKISFMILPLVIITMHKNWKGSIFGGLMMGIVLSLNGYIYGAPLIGLIGLWQAMLVATGSRILLGFILALIKKFINRIKIFSQTLIVVISALLLNHILFLGLVAMISEKYTLMLIIMGATVNVAIEWPTVITLSLASIPFINYLKSKDDSEDRY